MSKRIRLSKGLIVVAIWVLGAVILTFALTQIRDYAGIINDSGVVRGGTQRVAKMTLAGENADETQQRVSNLLDKLEKRENERLYRGPETLRFMEDLAAVDNQWQLIEREVERIERHETSTDRLVELSEEHFRLADQMVLSAQQRAEHDFLWTGIMCTVLFLLASTIMVFMRNDRITKLKKAYFTDTLTKRRNLFAFEEQAQELLSGAPNGAYLVMYTNISNFRLINETYGYEVGNQLIITLARLLDSACRRSEMAAHANADHFALLLRNEPDRAEKLCNQIEEKLRSEPELHFTAALAFGCGVCEAENTNDIPLLLSNAIAVLKNAPSGVRVARYDQAFKSALDLKSCIEQREDQALANREFQMYLQPKNNLADKTLVGAEALVRWNSPELGFLTPDTFIPVFEKNGFIVQLDFYMLKRACQSYPLPGPDGRPLVVSVNMSRVTILQEGFVERVRRIVDSSRIPHEAIELEVTESAFVAEENAVIDTLSELKALGFRLSMDDFGSGYSSLNLLRKLSIDVLKLDRGFLSESADSARTRSVIKSVVEMADNLNLSIVCEGVETAEQAVMLHGLGCRTGQGYVFSKPLPEAEFRARFHMPAVNANAATGAGEATATPTPSATPRPAFAPAPEKSRADLLPDDASDAPFAASAH